ncbi:hypothetical protein Tco_1237480 [Tanacetum coccineum]
MAAFRVLETQFQKFIKPKFSLDDDDGIMTREQDTRSSSRNDADANHADIKTIYDEEPIAENFKTMVSSQVDVNNDLSKPVTAHYLPKERDFAFAKPHHVIASSESRNSSKNMPRFCSNDMVHNHYLEEKWKPPGRSFKTVGLRWVPTRKIFTSSTTTVDSEPPHGSNTYITNLHECIQNLDSSAGTSFNVIRNKLLLNVGTLSIRRRKNQVWIKRKVKSETNGYMGKNFDTEIYARSSPRGFFNVYLLL